MRTGPLVRRFAVAVTVGLALMGGGWLAWTWHESRLPATYNVMDYGTLDHGGGRTLVDDSHGGAGADAHGATPVSVVDLKEKATGAPDVRFSLSAENATVRLPSGAVIEALTFNGGVPGPELRASEGDLVEVTLRNRDVEGGITLHWHGIDVPNAEDGVAGVTQDAVMPGKRHVYRFRADQAGTFWYHTHQASAEQVKRGLFGAFVIEPDEGAGSAGLDLALVAHDFAGVHTLNAADGVQERAVGVGTDVRLRLVNSDSASRRFTVSGTPFRVVAIDGTDVNEPEPIEGEALVLAAGGRYDVAFTMPPSPVAVALPGTQTAFVLSERGNAHAPTTDPDKDFDPIAYGRPTATPFGAADEEAQFDRSFRFEIGRKPGFLNGRPGLHWTINGGIFPDVPIFLVEEGDRVKVTITNKTDTVHPMHLHGHHALVLTRDGEPTSGSPWWIDTLDVLPGESYEIAFVADNPGLWMNHCHILGHAVEGLTMHVAYAGVRTPFTAGGTTHNHPE